MTYGATTIQLAIFVQNQYVPANQLWAEANVGEILSFSTIGPNITQATGSVGGSLVTITSQADRLDIHLQPMQEGVLAAPDTGLPLFFFDYNNAIENGCRISNLIMANAAVVRLAVIIQGHELTADDDHSVEVISRGLQGLPVPPRTNGLTYQIAVPFSSQVNSARIKQLIRWQSVQSQLVQMQAMGNQPNPVVVTHHAAHFYVDVALEEVALLEEGIRLDLMRELSSIASRVFDGGYDAIQ